MYFGGLDKSSCSRIVFRLLSTASAPVFSSPVASCFIVVQTSDIYLCFGLIFGNFFVDFPAYICINRRYTCVWIVLISCIASSAHNPHGLSRVYLA